MKITYKNWTFLFSQTESAKPTREQSLSCESISADTLTAVVRCNDPTIMAFAKNDPIRVWENDSDASMQTYYLRSITRTGATSYRLVAWSAVGLLAAMAHKGGIYTGQTVAEVVKEICGNVPVVVKSVFANTKLYGWLPYCQPNADRRGKSARDNLAQVLFAIGAYLTTDLNGVLHIDALWDGATSTIGRNRMYARGGKVSYSDPISAVTVTEHQYIAGTDEKELFSGTSQQGDIITFSEPMHSLTATGFTILESGANYAKISSGSGSLKGNTYIHNTRLVTQTVTENAAENVKSVTDATLVSLVNSSAVAKRLADYYKCRETITNGIVSGQEKPGHVVSVYHPYDKKMVSACIVSLDTTMSGTLKSEMTALVGFLPPQPSNLEYYDARVVLTGEGDWDPPEGVENVRYVMFSGAQGGQAGLAGGTSSGSKLHSYSHTSSFSGEVIGQGRVSLWGGPGGKGGLGGPGGKGSKILQGTLAVKHGQPIHFNCGIGGHGAEYNVEAAVEGEEGGVTTFGVLTTDNGTYPAETGWLDVVTGDVFASTGLDGLPGGDGAGAPDDYTIPSNSDSLNEILKYKPATGAVDEDGVTWPGGPTREKDGQENVAYWQTYLTNPQYKVGAWAGYALGPGGAAGVILELSTQKGTLANNIPSGANAANGLQGATPTLTPKKPGLTIGGRGGYGGGGGSCPSWAGAEKDPRSYTGSITTDGGEPGAGGLGGPGGPGGDGCIIIYYRNKKELQSGPLVTSNNLGLLDSIGRRMIV